MKLFSPLVLGAIRIVLFALSWLNTYLVSIDKQPLPVVSEDQMAWFITFVISVWTMVKDNPFKRQKKPAEEDPSAK